MIWLDSAQAEQLGLKAQRILNKCTHGCSVVCCCFALYLLFFFFFYSYTINGPVFGKKNKHFKWAESYKNWLMVERKESQLSLKTHKEYTNLHLYRPIYCTLKTVCVNTVHPHTQSKARGTQIHSQILQLLCPLYLNSKAIILKKTQYTVFIELMMTQICVPVIPDKNITHQQTILSSKNKQKTPVF